MKHVFIFLLSLVLQADGMKPNLSCCKRRLNNLKAIVALFHEEQLQFEQPEQKAPTKGIRKICHKSHTTPILSAKL